MNQYKIYYQNRASFGMWDTIKADSIEDAIKRFTKQNKGCVITSVALVGAI